MNKEVQQFLDDLMMLDEEKYDMLQELRKIVHRQCPSVSERMLYGGIMFSLEEDFGGLFVRRNHISFEFGKGYTFKDPAKRLEGTGKFRRHLKLSSIADIKDKDVDFFVRQVS